MKTIRSALGFTAAFPALFALDTSAAVPFPQLSGAAPSGITVPSAPSGSTLTISQTVGTSHTLDWTSFDVPFGSKVEFSLTGPQSAILNRVRGGSPSQILGDLNAFFMDAGVSKTGGRIFLINPNGVLFGSSAHVNVGHLVASTLDLLGDFGDGTKGYTFEAAPGAVPASIRNQGLLTATDGSIFLIGDSVLNSGSIRATKGVVGLASGSKVELRLLDPDNPEISVVSVERESTGTPGTDGSVHHSAGASIEAARVELAAASGNPLALAINTKGLVKATTADQIRGLFRASASKAGVPAGTVRTEGTVEQVDSSGADALPTRVTGTSLDLGGTFQLAQGGSLQAVSAGPVVGTSPLNVKGTTKVTAKSGDGTAQDIDLGDFNDFVGAVSVEGGNVTLSDVNGLTVGDADVKGNLIAVAGGDLERAAGTVLSVGGTTRLEARESGGAARDIRFGEFNLFGGAVEVTGARNASVESAGALTLGETKVEGNLAVVADGKVGQAEGTKVSVGGTTAVSAFAGPGKVSDIELDGRDNDFATVTVGAGHDVTLTDRNGIELGASTVSGDLAVTANGKVGQSAGTKVSVEGTTRLAAGAGNDIELKETGNRLARVEVRSGKDVTLVDADGIELGASRVSGDLNVTAKGAIGESGAVVVEGTTTVDAGVENNILLDHLGNDFATVRVKGGREVTIVDANGLTVSGGSASLRATAKGTDPAKPGEKDVTVRDYTTAGGLVATAENGSVVQGGEVHVGTTATLTGTERVRQEEGARLVIGEMLTIDGGTGVELGNPGNDLATVSLKSGGNANVGDAGAVTIAGAEVEGALGVTAGGTIRSAGPLNVKGTTKVTAKSGDGTAQDIDLGDFNDFVGAVSVEGGNVTLSDVNGLTVGDADVKGNLIAVAGGDLERAAGTVLSVGGTTRLEARESGGAARDIRFGEFNLFGGAVEVTGARNASVESAGALTLGETKVEGNLAVVADGKVGQAEGTKVSVGGTTAVSAFAGPGKVSDIELDGRDNDFATVTVGAGRNVTLTDRNGIELGASTVSGDLAVTANGKVGQSAGTKVSVEGTTRLAAGAGNDIELKETGNRLARVEVRSGKDVTLVDADGIELGASRVSGDLNVTAKGAIGESGAVVVEGTTTVDAGVENNILLDHLGNDFATVRVKGGREVTIVDANGLTVSGGSASLRATAKGTDPAKPGEKDVTVRDYTTAGGLVATAENGSVVQGGEVHVGTTATLTGTERVRQEEGARLVIGEMLTIDGGTGVELGNPGNDLATVSLKSGGNANVGDAGAVTIAGAEVEGALGVTAGGTIRSAGPLNVKGTTKVTAKSGDGTAQDIDLGDFNDFVGAVSVEGGNVTLSDVNGLTVGDADVKGNLIAVAGGDLERAAGTVLSVGGTTRLEARESGGAARDIRFGEFNLFGGAVEVTGARNASVESAGALTLGETKVEGNLAVVADGKVGQAEGTKVSVGGTTAVSAFAGPGKVSDIELDGRDNDFATVTVGAGRNVTLTDRNGIELGASTVSGDLAVTANGKVGQSAGTKVSVEGTTRLAAGAGNDIELKETGNRLARVEVRSGKDVTLVDADGIELGASRVSGDLNVTAKGAIGESGAVVVEGTTTVDAGVENNILLDHLGNDFATVRVKGGREVTIVDANGLTVSGGSASLRATAKGTDPAKPGEKDVTVRDYTTAGGLVATAENGSVVQGGEVHVGTTATLTGTERVRQEEGARLVIGEMLTIDGGTGVELGNPGNDLATVSLKSGGNANVGDAGAVTIAGAEVEGALGVTAGGTIRSAGPLNVKGTTKVTAKSGDGTAQDIDLGDFNDFVGAVSVEGGNVTLSDVNGLTVGDADVKGNLNLTANGSITDSGAVKVEKTVTMAAGEGNDIVLDGDQNDFTIVGVTSARNVTLRDRTGIELNASKISGDLTLTSKGEIGDLGGLAVTGSTTLDAGVDNNILLDHLENNFTTVSIVHAKNVTLVDSTELDLGKSTVSGVLKVTTGGTITDSGFVTVDGETTLDAGTGNDIRLDGEGNDFSAVEVIAGRNVVLVDSGALTVKGASQNLVASAKGSDPDRPGDRDLTIRSYAVTGSLTGTADGGAVVLEGGVTAGSSASLVAAGEIRQGDGATFRVAGLADLGAGTGVSLGGAGNDFSTVQVRSGNNATLTDATGIDLGASSVQGNLNLTAGGAVTDSGNVSVDATTTLTAKGTGGGGELSYDITLDTPGNDLNAVDVMGGNNVILRDGKNGMTVSAPSIAGNLDLATTAGDLTLSGAAVKAGGAVIGSATGGSIKHVGDSGLIEGDSIKLVSTGGDILVQSLRAKTISEIRTFTDNRRFEANGPVTFDQFAIGGVIESGTVRALHQDNSFGNPTTRQAIRENPSAFLKGTDVEVFLGAPENLFVDQTGVRQFDVSRYAVVVDLPQSLIDKIPEAGGTAGGTARDVKYRGPDGKPVSVFGPLKRSLSIEPRIR